MNFCLVRFKFLDFLCRRMKSVTVKKSQIHGEGVFAARKIKKGEIVLRWNNSHKLTKKEVHKLSEKEKRYISFIKGEYILMQPPERYVNHSCDANTYAKNFCDIAKRDIKKGEEITADYSEEGVPVDMKCNCGSKNCKKIIKATI